MIAEFVSRNTDNPGNNQSERFKNYQYLPVIIKDQ